jgi:hypothetical protein
MKTRQRQKTGSGLVLILLAMTCGAYFGHADEPEDVAVKFIQKLGGTITRDEKAPNKPIVGVALSGITDVDLKHLAGFKQLKTLVFDFTGVTDAGLKELAGLKQLQTLYLRGTNVTDARGSEVSVPGGTGDPLG